MSGVVARRWLRNGALTATDWLDGEPSERELSAQRACVDSANWTVELAYSQATVDTLRAQLEAAERLVVAVEVQAEENFQRAEAAEADAARYRWLRVNEQDRCDAFLAGAFEDLDAAIDAAIARTKEETK